jgi:hypothetical protein
MPNRQEIRVHEHGLHRARFERMTTDELVDGLRAKRFKKETYAREVLRERGVDA